MSPGDLLGRLHERWNARDATGFAALFDDTGVSIGFDGSTEVGARVIAEHLAAIFADHVPAHYVGRVDQVSQLGPEVVIVRASAGMVPPDGGSELIPDRNVIQTIVATRAGDNWKIALLQNTPARFDGRPHAVEEMTAALRQLR
jgi:uncharacterized protein (TIGR02246 family)